MPLAKEAFALQVGLAKGTVDQEMLGQMAGQFSGYFAPELGWDVPAAGLSGKGNFMDMMGSVTPVWLGLVNTKAENTRFDAVSPSMIKVTQSYTNHILDNAGAVIAGTEGDILVEHTCTFVDGKISHWHQAYDAELMNKKRNLEVEAKATVYQTPADLGAPAKVMGEEGTGAKMWMFTSQGKKLSRIAIDAGFDWVKTVSPMLPGCPEWCPATHFGYLESGEMVRLQRPACTSTQHATHPMQHPATAGCQAQGRHGEDNQGGRVILYPAGPPARDEPVGGDD